jgi:hypothetical protein
MRNYNAMLNNNFYLLVTGALRGQWRDGKQRKDGWEFLPYFVRREDCEAARLLVAFLAGAGGVTFCSTPRASVR